MMQSLNNLPKCLCEVEELLSNILLGDIPSSQDLLCVLTAAFKSREPTLEMLSFAVISNWAKSMTPRFVESLQRLLTSEPDSLAAHILFVKCILAAAPHHPILADSLKRHILWLLHHAPHLARWDNWLFIPTGYEEVYNDLRSAWVCACDCQPNDANLLYQAAVMLRLDDYAMAAHVLDRGLALEPNNPRWYHQRGSLLLKVLEGQPSGKERQSLASTAAHWLAEAALREHGLGQVYAQISLSRALFAADSHTQAASLVKDLINVQPLECDVGVDFEVKHLGHTILGLIALRNADGQQAIYHLHASVQDVADSVVNIYGPTMSLAQELLRVEAQHAVIDYLANCTFWQTEDHRQDQWICQIKQGQVPQWSMQMDRVLSPFDCDL
ncbi:MAG: hypothetical protein U0736_20800 [Gemmataceae bacterium]